MLPNALCVYYPPAWYITAGPGGCCGIKDFKRNMRSCSLCPREVREPQKLLISVVLLPRFLEQGAEERGNWNKVVGEGESWGCKFGKPDIARTSPIPKYKIWSSAKAKLFWALTWYTGGYSFNNGLQSSRRCTENMGAINCRLDVEMCGNQNECYV